MSAKEIGVIGQRYKNRKTNEEGTLKARFEDKSALEFVDDSGESFVISFASFRSNWRKVADTTIPVVETTVEEVPEKVKEISFEDFEKALKRKSKDFSIENKKNVWTITKGDIVVAKITKSNKSFHLAVMPDVYTCSRNRRSIIKPDTIHFDSRFSDDNDFLSVSFDTIATTIEQVLAVFEEAILNINLYGYIIED